MTVEDWNVIDGVGIDRRSGRLNIHIADHLDWDENLEYHLHAIEKKIGACLQFVEGGQLYEEFPGERERPVEISLIYKHEPHGFALKFLDALGKQLAEEKGIHFNCYGIPDTGRGDKNPG